MNKSDSKNKDSQVKIHVISGWFSTESDEVDSRKKKLGSPEIRRESFHSVWLEAIHTYLKPDRVTIVDSNSPVKPPKNIRDKSEWLTLPKNLGHASHLAPGSSRSGFLEAMIHGLTWAENFASDTTIILYVEQDALVFGEGFRNRVISETQKARVVMGDGRGTPQPSEISLLALRKSSLPGLLRKLLKIQLRDSVLSPEAKLVWATSWIPVWLLSFIGAASLNLANWFARNISWRKTWSFGYGRSRPINFGDKVRYAQHMSDSELQTWLELSESQ